MRKFAGYPINLGCGGFSPFAIFVLLLCLHIAHSAISFMNAEAEGITT